MKHAMADEYPPFTLEKPRYNQVSYYIYITLVHGVVVTGYYRT